MLSAARGQVKAWRRSGRHPLAVKILATIYRHAREFRTLLILPFALIQMRRTREQREPGSLLSLAFEGYGGAIRPMQIREEIGGLVDVVHSLRPERILEIGTASGGTLYLLTRSAPDGAHIVSVDLPGGWFGGGYPLWKRTLYRAFPRPGQRIDLIRANSHATSTFDRVKEALGGERLDLLMIDGDHTYEGVKHDFELYAPLVRSGGVIALHDIVPNREEPAAQVDRFWREVSRGRITQELVADWRQIGAGIGIVQM